MSRYEMVECDHCKRTSKRDEADGWIEVRLVSPYRTLGDLWREGTFCGPPCLMAYMQPRAAATQPAP